MDSVFLVLARDSVSITLGHNKIKGSEDGTQCYNGTSGEHQTKREGVLWEGKRTGPSRGETTEGPLHAFGMRATREVQGLNCPLQPLRSCLRHHSLKIEQPTTDPNDRLDCGICVYSSMQRGSRWRDERALRAHDLHANVEVEHVESIPVEG